ncbi:hypothetical protein DRE_06253 [Drechslerella stenobrocha 248]|uniref:RNase MRP protein 1 RNA binding domain-containing protein n=1 Tax=Drechslerella stenobrocha 248 TaxID=1043628 RepID=W7HPR0_9PEZI|nr:hypothetical protein DRE_06253 [Drechslerella stenobrocha 248]
MTSRPATSPAALIAILTHERNLLHLVLYKSRNQHRASRWLRWLRMLKRSLERLILLLEHIPPANGGSENPADDDDDDDDDDDNGEKELRDALTADASAAALLSHLHVAIVPGCHTAFTHLVTSTQYAGIGMLLLACLARIHSSLQPFTYTADPEKPAEHAPMALQQQLQDPTGHERGSQPTEDPGEVISRNSTALLGRPQTRTVTAIEAEVEERGGNAKAVKRQRVKMRTDEPLVGATAIGGNQEPGNRARPAAKPRTAIDDIFAGL